MEKYIEEHDDLSNNFENKLKNAMNDFYNCLVDLNVLDERLMRNEKNRSLSLLKDNLDVREDQFADFYRTTYKASFAYLAQAQRHRTLKYQMQILKNKEYFVPPIIENDEKLKDEWLNDMNKVKDFNPQGELVLIKENGTYNDFILKCEERLCSAAQLEICRKTKDILTSYQKYLEEHDDPLKKDILNYTKGARCTFPEFKCSEDCHFREGKTLIRKI